MKAAIWTKYGSPETLQVEEIDKPVPKDNEVLIKIKSATVTAGDCELRDLTLPYLYRLPMRLFIGIIKPIRIPVLGMELAGVVESAGSSVKRFKPGDAVLAATGIKMGGNAEYICLPEVESDMNGPIVLKLENISFNEAAPLPNGGLEALHFIRKAKITKETKKILIIGAGGSIGTYAVQLAKLMGGQVTSVDKKDKGEILFSLGSEKFIDYLSEDYSKSETTYDVILDIAGNNSLGKGIKVLKKNGLYLIANPTLPKLLQRLWHSVFSNTKFFIGAGSQKTEDLQYLTDLLGSGKIKSIIDKVYTLDQISESHRYVEKGIKTGHVVISVD